MKKLMIVLIGLLFIGCATYYDALRDNTLWRGKKKEKTEITYKELSFCQKEVYSKDCVTRTKRLYDKNIKLKGKRMYKVTQQRTLDKIIILDIKLMLITYLNGTNASSERMRLSKVSSTMPFLEKDIRSSFYFAYPWQVIVYSNCTTLQREEEKNIDIIETFLPGNIIDKPIKCPLIILKQEVTYNCIGGPEARISMINVTAKIIKAWKIKFYCYNDFNERVFGYGSKECFNGIAQSESIDKYDTRTVRWTLHGFDNTTRIKAKITRIHFTDGSTWKIK